MYQDSEIDMLRGIASKGEKRPVTKAGIIFYERGKDGRGHPCLNIVYGKSTRYGVGMYNCLPKGGIENQSPLVGGAREAEEETGISLEKMLGKDGWRHLLKGAPVENLQSPGYPGVQVIKASAEPVSDHVYISRHGRKFRMQFFAVEVKGLNELKADLKRIPENAASHKLPSYEECMEIMRTGIVKAGAEPWQNNKDVMLFDAPVLTALERKYGTVANRESWQVMCDTLRGKEYEPLKEQLNLLKKHFEKMKIVGDAGPMPKFDTSDQPLGLYWEEGAIGRASGFLRDSIKQADGSLIYDAVMWGRSIARKHQGRSEENIVAGAEIAGLTEFLSKIAPMELAVASIGPDGTLDHRILELVSRQVPSASRWAERIATPPAVDAGRTGR